MCIFSYCLDFLLYWGKPKAYYKSGNEIHSQTPFPHFSKLMCYGSQVMLSKICIGTVVAIWANLVTCGFLVFLKSRNKFFSCMPLSDTSFSPALFSSARPSCRLGGSSVGALIAMKWNVELTVPLQAITSLLPQGSSGLEALPCYPAHSEP